MEPQEQSQGRRIPWITIALVLIALFTFLQSSDYAQSIPMPYGGFGVTSPSGGVPRQGMMVEDSVQTSIAPAYYPQYQDDVSATDTREFMKMDYNAQMRTRHVPELMRRAETIVRGHAGRVDSISSSEKYGYLSFVISASKFEQFRNEIESLVGSKFLTVNIQSQNLLPQKVSIEEQQKMVEKALADMRTQRASLVGSHKTSIGSLEGQISTNEVELAALRAEITNDPVRRAQINDRIAVLTNALTTLKARLANENSSYTNTLASYDNQIQYYVDALAGVKQEDQNLLDSVATVRSTVSVNWISLWDIAHLYLPGQWIPVLLLLAGILTYYFFERRRI